ncbi:MAG: chorismate--pyruvate lyase [Neptuniibacter caesariensis]|uniref:Probable chorismate pyruvate-lyase n=1 Tax=Neptuniibacter caesariensis TaxID=207954 RepID=A0A2G6JP40_NEPCE|nr:MAG: chorismate--pyruvate lyase [Neptuniibacter caesariensis]
MPIKAALTQQSFDTRWTFLRRPFEQVTPQAWRTWLTDSGSLTQRLVRLSKGDFRVEVIRQGWFRPTRSEALELGINARQFTLVREVQLVGNDQPWVFARSIIPAQTLTGRQRQLRMLGNRSLGTLLFTDPTMRRAPLQISRLKTRDQCQVWARRSVFFLSDKPLLVSEVFLPALLQVK